MLVAVAEGLKWVPPSPSRCTPMSKTRGWFCKFWKAPGECRSGSACCNRSWGCGFLLCSYPFCSTLGHGSVQEMHSSLCSEAVLPRALMAEIMGAKTMKTDSDLDRSGNSRFCQGASVTVGQEQQNKTHATTKVAQQPSEDEQDNT